MMFAAIFLLFAGEQTVSAQDLANYPAAFVDIGFGARPLGMAGAYTAIANDVQSVLWNPAGLAGVPFVQGTFSTTRQFGLIPYQMAAAAFRFGVNWVHSEGIILSGDDAMREFTFLMGAAYEKRWPNGNYLRGGTVVSYRNASFGKNAPRGSGAVTGSVSGFAVDFGIQYSPAEHYILAAVLKNAVNYLQWNTSTIGKYSEGTPMQLVFGLGAVNILNFNFDLDIEKTLYKDIPDKFAFGVERPLFKYFYLRGGFSRGLVPSDLSSTAFGGGLHHAFPRGFRLTLDFAYILQDLNNNFRLSVTFDLK
ncbi:hypothetical protein BMS3Abin05_00007 [bacterium BMS3Abin05]|nr:hypothetical protein BMS3Abin05_00007 [bacterium BMS3Abin05]GBE26665.1 hypothetical protein BMS3Bbin03_00580 [bacterium BMS3Bbin03]